MRRNGSVGLPEGVPTALPVHLLRKDGRGLRLLSFPMTVAAPREVGLQEIRMETFLPADEESESVLRRLPAESSPAPGP